MTRARCAIRAFGGLVLGGRYGWETLEAFQGITVGFPVRSWPTVASTSLASVIDAE